MTKVLSSYLGIIVPIMTLIFMPTLYLCGEQNCELNPIKPLQDINWIDFKPHIVKSLSSLNQSIKSYYVLIDRGRPPKRTPGGSRNPCQSLIIALVPGEDNINDENNCTIESEALLGLTSSIKPIIWVYISEQSQSNLEAEFALVDSQEYLVYRESITLEKTPGILGIPLTEPLKSEQIYRWTFSLQHYPFNPSNNPMVEGLIAWKPLGLNLTNQLETIESFPDLISIYIEHEFWYNALELAGKRFCQTSNNQQISDQWSNVLLLLGLETITTVPIINCEDLQLQIDRLIPTVIGFES